MAEPTENLGRAPGSCGVCGQARMAKPFFPIVPCEKTKKATDLFPLLSRTWSSPFLEFLPLVGGIDNMDGHVEQRCIWWASAAGAERRDTFYCKNPAWDGRVKVMGEGRRGIVTKWPKKQRRLVLIEAWVLAFQLPSREPIHQYKLLATHWCFPWKLVPGQTGSRVTHNKQQMAEG